jgi:CHAT domain-containing protein/tetratricopeptide (TPR) repeat protein
VLLLLSHACARYDYQAAWDAAIGQQRRGHPGEALKQAEAGASRASRDHSTAWEWKFRLLAAELRLDRGEDAAKLETIARIPPAGPEYDGVRARGRYLQGRVLYSHQNFESAIPVLRDAQRMASDAHDRDVLLDAEFMEGNCLTRISRNAEAGRVYASALDAAEQAGDHYHRLGAMINLGFNRLRQSRFDEALSNFETVVRETGPDSLTMHSVALSNAGICYSRLGEFERAFAAQKQAIEIQEKAAVTPFLEQTLAETGNNLILAGKQQLAAPYLERAFGMAQELKKPVDAAMLAGNLAVAHIGLADWNRAASFNDQAVSLKRKIPGADTSYNTLNAALIAAGRGDGALAGQLFKTCLKTGGKTPAILWEANSGLGELYSQSDPALAGRYFEAALGIIEQTRSELSNPEYRISYFARLMHFYQVYVDALCRRGEWEKALEVADFSRARVLAERTSGAVPKRLPAAEMKRIAGQSGQIVFYWLAPERSYAWVLSKGMIHGVGLASASEIQKQASAYSATVDDTLVDPLASAIPAASKLRDLVVKPIAQWLNPQTPAVVITDGVLNNINLETLPVYGERPHYWIEDVALRVAPSISALVSGGREHSASPPSLLLIGDPAPPDTSLPPLRSAALEVQSVSGQFAAASEAVYRQKLATPRAYLDNNPERFSLIHFTAHALANVESPLDSAVALSPSGRDYKLYARDIVERPIHAELVTISSCRGAGARSYTGEGMVGFAWAFLRAGAQNVIAGLWDVNDDSTARLMKTLYENLKSEPPAAALRRAKLSMLHASPPWSRPYYWGAFQLYTTTP